MIIGLNKWNDPETSFTQTNNPTEETLRKMQAPASLESCGPTSATMLAAACGYNVRIATPGGYEPQPEEILFDYFNDPRNAQRLRIVRSSVDPGLWMGNEIPQFYEVAVPAVFGVPCKFYDSLTLPDILMALSQNRGVMLTLKKPGHFIALVAYDQEAEQFIYNDPWPGNQWPTELIGKPAFNRRIRAAELFFNLKPYRVEIG